jgi:hypothetical protein
VEVSLREKDKAEVVDDHERGFGSSFISFNKNDNVEVKSEFEKIESIPDKISPKIEDGKLTSIKLKILFIKLLQL